MPFRFQKSSCVVVGTFNMYILHPQWLVKHGIIESGTEVGIETNFTRPGFRFRFPKYEAVWSVAPDRLAIESRNPGTDCGSAVAKVLEALPETPLIAIGNNDVYEASRDELASLPSAIRDFPQPQSLGDGQTVAQQTFHFGVKQEEGRIINVQLAIQEGNIELSCNAHLGLENVSDANAKAIAAGKRFFQDRESSEELAQHFFGVTIHHDVNDS